jgi:hypothetical protein
MHALAPEEGEYLPAAHSVQLLDEEEEEKHTHEIDPAEHRLMGRSLTDSTKT